MNQYNNTIGNIISALEIF